MCEILLREILRSAIPTPFLILSERMYSIQSFGKSLLCVCDYLNLAIASVPQNELEGDSANKVLSLLLQIALTTRRWSLFTREW